MAKNTKAGSGLATAAAVAGAAAGAYYLFGSKNARENREKVKTWVSRARKEIRTEAKKLKDVAMDQRTYKRLADMVISRYQDMEGFTKREGSELMKILMSEWENMNKPVRKTASGRKSTRRTGKSSGNGR
jgi:hypothetical protein